MHQAHLAAAQAAARRKQVYIIHGYMASPADHWFPWLGRQLRGDGIDADILPMPEPERPSATAWDAFLRERVRRLDEDSFFVAHSLGCISLLRLLLATGKPVGGMVLVSGFAEPLQDLPQLDEFVAGVDGFARLRQTVPRRSVIAARDDAIVPYAHTRRLAQALEAPLLTLEKGGHFLGREGFQEFPLVYTELRRMAGAGAAATPSAA